MRSFVRRHRHRLAFAIILLMLVVTLLWHLVPDHPLLAWQGWIDLVLEKLRGAPFPLFILMVGVLPLAGVPVTTLYLAAGAVYSPVFGLPATLGGICIGVLLNLLLSYWIARFFHSPVNRLLQRFGASLPTFSKLPPWKVVLLVRITPGAPLIVQNFLLGMAGVPLAPYLLVSILAELLIALGYLTAGNSFATGRWGLLLLGAGVVAAAVLLASLLRKRTSPGDSSG